MLIVVNIKHPSVKNPSFAICTLTRSIKVLGMITRRQLNAAEQLECCAAQVFHISASTVTEKYHKNLNVNGRQTALLNNVHRFSGRF